MSNDLVSRQWLLDEYDKRHEGPPGGARKLIEEAPAVADVRPVKRGEWVEEKDRLYRWHCSECGYVIGIAQMDANFCPNCGADMRPVPEPPKREEGAEG